MVVVVYPPATNRTSSALHLHAAVSSRAAVYGRRGVHQTACASVKAARGPCSAICLVMVVLVLEVVKMVCVELLVPIRAAQSEA